MWATTVHLTWRFSSNYSITFNYFLSASCLQDTLSLFCTSVCGATIRFCHPKKVVKNVLNTTWWWNFHMEEVFFSPAAAIMVKKLSSQDIFTWIEVSTPLQAYFYIRVVFVFVYLWSSSLFWNRSAATDAGRSEMVPRGARPFWGVLLSPATRFADWSSTPTQMKRRAECPQQHLTPSPASRSSLHTDTVTDVAAIINNCLGKWKRSKRSQHDLCLSVSNCTVWGTLLRNRDANIYKAITPHNAVYKKKKLTVGPEGEEAVWQSSSEERSGELEG